MVLYTLISRDEVLKRKIYWSTNDYQQAKLHVDELVLADGPIASGKISPFYKTRQIQNSVLIPRLLSHSSICLHVLVKSPERDQVQNTRPDSHQIRTKNLRNQQRNSRSQGELSPANQLYTPHREAKWQECACLSNVQST